MNVQVVAGGPATPEEVAALTAALEVLLAAPAPDSQPAVSPWRWSGRRWSGAGSDRRATWRR